MGLSLTEMAKKLTKMDVTFATIRNWEKGVTTPNCHDIADLAMFFGKNVSYFFDKQEGV